MIAERASARQGWRLALRGGRGGQGSRGAEGQRGPVWVIRFPINK